MWQFYFYFLPWINRTSKTLFDFTRADQVGNWIECSDTIKTTGMSKAVIVIQKTHLVQRGILFTLFNPRPNKLGYAAVRCDTNFDLSDYNCITIKCRGQGINFKYKMLLRHKGMDINSMVFGQTFTVINKLFSNFFNQFFNNGICIFIYFHFY